MRDMALDGQKGIAIVLMVFGHAVCSGPVRDFIYLFHMPVFFLAAGWLFHGADDGAALGRGILRRVVRIWWPYAFWTTALIACHDLLLAAGVYSAAASADSLYVRQGMGVEWGWSEIFCRCMRALVLMGGGTGLCAPYWFLNVLFLAATGYLLLDFCCRRLKVGSCFAMTLLACAAIVAGRYGHGKLLQVLEDRILVRQVLTAFALLHLGVLLRAANWRLERFGRMVVAAVGVICCALLLDLRRLGRVELVTNEYPSVIFLVVSSVLGWYLLSAAAILSGRMLPVLAAVGRHTMPILLLHLLAFKCLDAVAIAMRGDDALLLSCPFRTYEGPLWCLGYVLVGIVIPIGLNAGWWGLWRASRKRFAELFRRILT